MAFDLNKVKEVAEDRLRAKGFKVLKDDPRGGLKARMWAALDGSGSTENLWMSGAMQEAIQLVLGPTLAVDDDGNLPVGVFNAGDNFTLLSEDMTKDNYDGYVSRNIVDSRGNKHIDLFGGTDYSPILYGILEKENFFETKRKWFKTQTTLIPNPNQDPTVIEFFTDGACSDEDRQRTIELLQTLETANAKVYVLFIGVGNADFSFLASLANRFSNAGFVSVKDLAQAVKGNADKIMELLLPDEMLTWFKK